jgi:SAM-dependent methyltransferase
MAIAGADWLERCAPHLPGAVARYLAGEISAETALMQLVIELSGPDELEALLGALERQPQDNVAARRLGELQQAASRHRPAWSTLKAILAGVHHDSVEMPPEQTLAYWRAAFDGAVAISPEASVALYSLGDADLLAAATAEVVERLRSWGLLGRDRRALEIGCGIGRFLAALAGDLERVVGIDISWRMVECARRRCRGLGNVHLVQCGGQDLAFLADQAIDLVLAIDSFPYLVQSGPDLPARHMRDAVRVLRPGGDLLVFNFSYRGDIERDRDEARRLAGEAGLAVLRNGTREFTRWDGSTFHFRKRAATDR